MPLLKVNQIASYSGNTLTIGTTGDTVTLAAGSSVSGFGISWQSVQTTGFTASANKGYPLNTTSSAFTVTLPASPSVGDTIILVDYAGTFNTNTITLGRNGNKINGETANKMLTTNREGVTLTYIDSTQGWVASSGVNYGSQAIDPLNYSIDILVVGGGGGGGGEAGGGGGAGGFITSTQRIDVGSVYTIIVGDGGALSSGFANGASGSNSSITGSGITTITSAGGGGGSFWGADGKSGGSGGGSGGGTALAGSGNTPSTSPSQGSNGGAGQFTGTYRAGGGGGGASAVGGNGNGTTGVCGAGGAGTANSITGSSVTRAGGGGGGVNDATGTAGAGGSGGGGAGAKAPNNATSATANTGGGGGGGSTGNSGAGGKGIVILSVPTASYSGTSTGSPTITTSGANTILQFTGSGTYTG